MQVYLVNVDGLSMEQIKEVKEWAEKYAFMVNEWFNLSNILHGYLLYCAAELDQNIVSNIPFQCKLAKISNFELRNDKSIFYAYKRTLGS